jgi:hypothetical protein
MQPSTSNGLRDGALPPASIAAAGPSIRASCSAACLRGRFTSGTMAPWEFERDGEVVRVDTAVPLLALVEASADSANRNAPIDR